MQTVSAHVNNAGYMAESGPATGPLTPDPPGHASSPPGPRALGSNGIWPPSLQADSLQCYPKVFLLTPTPVSSSTFSCSPLLTLTSAPPAGFFPFLQGPALVAPPAEARSHLQEPPAAPTHTVFYVFSPPHTPPPHPQPSQHKGSFYDPDPESSRGLAQGHFSMRLSLCGSPSAHSSPCFSPALRKGALAFWCLIQYPHHPRASALSEVGGTSNCHLPPPP